MKLQRVVDLKLQYAGDAPYAAQGRSTLHVTWDLTLRSVGPDQCELTNLVELRSTPEFDAGIAASGAPLDAIKAQLLAALIPHNQEETPKFAADMARKAK